MLGLWFSISASVVLAEDRHYLGPAAYEHGPVAVHADAISADAEHVYADLEIRNVSTRRISYDPRGVLLRLPDGTTRSPIFPPADGGTPEGPVAIPPGGSERSRLVFAVALEPEARAALVFGSIEEEGTQLDLPHFPLRPDARTSSGNLEATVSAQRDSVSEVPSYRAASTVERDDIERHQPGSTPDALAYEPGVFITQSGHGRSSAYIRGLTGQQTVTLFDGIRINNSTYRQGPSQYLFAVDSQTVDHIELLRGGGSTQFGSDALGGVVLAVPVSPAMSKLEALASPDARLLLEPRLRVRAASADRQVGGRAELEAGVARPGGLLLGFLGGVGGRYLGLLESAGSVENPNPNTTIGRYPLVPRFAPDGRTQLGTGYKELTADGRLVVELPSRDRVTLAAYLYRQYDAPKTDRCPAPYAPYNSCLTYEEQFRHLAYAAYERTLAGWMENVRLTVSFQQQHERQRLDEPLVYSVYRSLDRVYTAGVTGRARGRQWRAGPDWTVDVSFGLDTYFDWITSSASLAFTNVNVQRTLSRGQNLGGSSYLYGGTFVDGELAYRERLTLRAGVRLSWFGAWVPEDTESSTQAVRRTWTPLVGHFGVEWRALPALSLLANVDHSFRAPNLDDLTGRLQVGPGFQFENPSLAPERATTIEAGLRLRTRPVVLEAWLFETLIRGAILKVPRNPDDCPANSEACRAAWSIFGLQNAPGLSEMRGAEGAISVRLPLGLSARATASYTWGEGPRLGTLPREPAVVLTGDRIPLTRVPPLNGTVELVWTHSSGLGLNADLRWAARQYRLSLADYKDADIPKYGTPGYAIFDVGAAYHLANWMRLLCRVENVIDKPYRRHGSSLNGAGRDYMLLLEAGLR